MDLTTEPPSPLPASSQPPIRASLAALFTACLGDFLFWNHSPGASVGVFCAGTALAMLVMGRPSRWAAVWLILLLAGCWQSIVELNFTNLFSLVFLLTGILAESHYGEGARLWQRISHALQGVLTAPRHWREFLASWRGLPALQPEARAETEKRLYRAFQALGPALLACGLFTVLLYLGSAAFADLLQRLFNQLVAWLAGFSAIRALLWLAWLGLGISIFWTARKGSPRSCKAPARWQRPDTTLARWQSILLLAGVNVVFFAANTVDAIHLWTGRILSPGTTYSQALHEGVQSLIVAVLIAAGCLIAIFQQDAAVASCRRIKALAVIWVLQNLLLIGAVFLRLKLYVEAYQMTELRVYVGCFLLLVITGFCLLTWHLLRGLLLGKLVLSNLSAVCALFFVLQFCDVSAWVAEWNVERWRRQPHRQLDLEYLAQLGPSAWPALMKVARSEASSDRPRAAQILLSNLAQNAAQEPADPDWRSLQRRRQARLAELAAFARL